MNEAEENKFKVEDDYLSNIKIKEEDYKLLKLDKLETKPDLVLNQVENNPPEHHYSEPKDKIKSPLFLKVVKEENSAAYFSNNILPLSKNKKIITKQILYPKVLESNNERLVESGNCQLPFHRFQDTENDKKKESKNKVPSKNTTFFCANCNYESKIRSKFLEHLRVHKDKKYSCEHCNYSSARKSTLTKHLNTHGVYGTNPTAPYKCANCAVQFRHRYNLIRHLTVSHSDGANPCLFTCTECAASFSRKCALKTHLQTHSKDTSFECAHCDYATSRRYSLLQHLLRHEKVTLKETETTCKVCSKQFLNSNRLRSHLRAECRKEDRSRVFCDRKAQVTEAHEEGLEDKYPFKCATCSFSTLNHSLLKYHIVSKHTKEPVFVCPSCDYSTFCRDSLLKHRRSEKHGTYSCVHCDFICFKYLYIQKHMKTHFK